MLIKFPTSCSQCEKHYYHKQEIKQIHGGTMCSYNNHYCTGLKKYKKLTSTSVYKKAPAFCPLRDDVERNKLKVQHSIDRLSDTDNSFVGVTGEKVIADAWFINELSSILRYEKDVNRAVETALRHYIKRYYS